MLSLAIENRDMKAKAAALRSTGKMPAVLYGPKKPSAPVVVSMVDFKKVWKAAGESSVIVLSDSEGNEHEALIHDIDVHPITGEPRHADFYVIEKGKKVGVAVPLSFVGVSSAVKDKGGILVKVRRDLDIEAAPRDLPKEFTVDISKLVELTDVILVKDLPMSPGVELKVPLDEVVASISVVKEEVEEAPAAIDMSAIEVEAKGKEVKEGEAPDSAAPAKEAASAGDKKGGEKK